MLCIMTDSNITLVILKIMDHTSHHKNKFLLRPNCCIFDKLINQFNKFIFLGVVGCLGVSMNLFFFN